MIRTSSTYIIVRDSGLLCVYVKAYKLTTEKAAKARAFKSLKNEFVPFRGDGKISVARNRFPPSLEMFNVYVYEETYSET